MTNSVLVWFIFFAIIICMIVLDLGVFHRDDHEIKTKEALWWTFIWIFLSLGFSLIIYILQGSEATLQYLTGYLIEKSLSIDNIFVFSMVFSYFHVPSKYTHRVLFWGILSALVMRGIMISIGVALFTRFHWLTYVFGIMLIITGIKLLFEKKGGQDLENRFLVRLCKKIIPFTHEYKGHKFFIRDGIIKATPLFLVLIVIEITDLIFAVDSIPAIFAITQDPLIIYTSNIFAILGLRSMYFILSNFLTVFQYVKYGLCGVLIFVGIKMLISHVYKIPILISLGIIITMLSLSVVLPLFLDFKKNNG
jgi:tellurite resistance protein TerC